MEGGQAARIKGCDPYFEAMNSTTSRDFLRPRNEPACTLYDAFQAEAEHRDGRALEDWTRMEREAVWRAARDYAQQHGLRVPTLEDVERAETFACGHADYGTTWAFRVADAMQRDRA